MGQRAKSDVQSFKAAGLSVLLVIAKESAEFIGRDSLDFEGTASLYAKLLWDGSRFVFDALQVGNEPDSQGASSFALGQTRFRTMLEVFARRFRALDPNVRLIAGGLVSGNPLWLLGRDYKTASGEQPWPDEDRVDTYGMPLALHPYDQRFPGAGGWGHGPIEGLLGAYESRRMALGGQRYWITEWGRTTDRPLEQAEYVREMGRYLLNEPRIEAAFYFCHSDAMVPPYGLVTASGQDKPSYREFRALKPPEFVLGFAQAHDAHPDLIGDPLEDEHAFGEDYNVQLAAKGMLVYSKQTGAKLFLPGVRV